MEVAGASAWLSAGARIAICSMLLLGSASAMWAPLGDEELVASADLIVVGEWREDKESSLRASSGAQGNIAVSEVLKGKRTLASVRIGHTASKFAHSSNDLTFRSGDRGLWLLRRAPGPEDVYLIDHPQRFVPIPGGEERIQKLRQLVKP